MRRFDSKGQGRFLDPRLEKLHFFGGHWCSRRKYRVARPLSTKHPIHLVLKSSLAARSRSFSRPQNRKFIAQLMVNLSRKWGIKVIQFANVGNHLHLVVRIGHRRTYKPFICALTGAIAHRLKGNIKKFWDYRPFSRVIYGFNAWLSMRDYMVVNQLEGGGVERSFAVILVKNGAVNTT